MHLLLDRKSSTEDTQYMLPFKTGDLTFEYGSIFFHVWTLTLHTQKKHSQEHSMETWEDMNVSCPTDKNVLGFEQRQKADQRKRWRSNPRMFYTTSTHA